MCCSVLFVGSLCLITCVVCVGVVFCLVCVLLRLCVGGLLFVCNALLQKKCFFVFDGGVCGLMFVCFVLCSASFLDYALCLLVV